MRDSTESHRGRRLQAIVPIASIIFLAVVTARCNNTGPTNPPTSSTLRIGVGQIQMNQLVQNLTVEPLIKIGEDGRIKPWLATSWSVSPDGLSLTLHLKPDVHFHDRSLLTAETVAEVLRTSLPQTMRTAFEDIDSIEAPSQNEIRFKLKRPSAFLLEALEGGIQKPGNASIGTGPFSQVTVGDRVEMRTNPDYHLGPAAIDEIVITRYPNVRAAWAEMLRNRLDMVYEVGADARDSLQSSSAVSVFTYVRHYQYIILFNPRIAALRSSEARRALNLAIDRKAVVEEGLEGHGLVSLGPIWPKHWAADSGVPTFTFDPARAAKTLSRESVLSFTCLVAADDERVGLEVKRQLQAVGVEMNLQEGSIESNLEAVMSGDFEAILWAGVSGPSLFRPYFWWHSRGYFNWGGFSSTAVDAALDAIRHSRTDAEYRAGVMRFQQAVVDDPPAIFLAWNERARAISRRFEVPNEPGVDVLGSLRLWRPVNMSN
jgi:peptide/nickel transport system substrate-binding protein